MTPKRSKENLKVSFSPTVQFAEESAVDITFEEPKHKGEESSHESDTVLCFLPSDIS